MKHLMSPRGLADLRRFASSDVLVAFDFDGTLAPIVSDPDAASLTPAIQKYVVEVTRRYPCVVISGRGRSDLRARVAGLGFRAAIGNHGAEPSRQANAFRKLVRRWALELGARLGDTPGIVLEDKDLSLSLHYRGARDKDSAFRSIEEAVAMLHDARVIRGKRVVNVVPRGAPDKGAALRAQCEELGCRAAIYVGDDETDEDAFRACDERRLLSVRVGFSRNSDATHYLKNQRSVRSLLEYLVEVRATPSSGKRGRSRSS